MQLQPILKLQRWGHAPKVLHFFLHRLSTTDNMSTADYYIITTWTKNLCSQNGITGVYFSGDTNFYIWFRKCTGLYCTSSCRKLWLLSSMCVETRIPCGSTGYALNYGERYCRRFASFSSCFSPEVNGLNKSCISYLITYIILYIIIIILLYMCS